MNTDFQVLLLLVGLALFIGIVASLYVRKWWMALRLKHRFTHASNAEEWTRQWLQQHHFELLGEQVVQHAAIVIDGVSYTTPIRIDFIVQKEGQRWGVETKSGYLATQATRAITRRQLLEYLIVFEVDGLLLVDYERGKVHTIAFDI